jgi:hypothetical protein
MPTRKQRRREAKSKRHEYEFVYVDAEGHELEEPPDDLLESAPKRPEERRNGTKPAAAAKKPARQQPQRGGRRVPQPPSWQRAFRRAGLLGVFVFVIFSFLSKQHGTSAYASAAGLAALYTALFVPFTYALDRFAYRRWQARESQSVPAKKKR